MGQCSISRQSADSATPFSTRAPHLDRAFNIMSLRPTSAHQQVSTWGGVSNQHSKTMEDCTDSESCDTCRMSFLYPHSLRSDICLALFVVKTYSYHVADVERDNEYALDRECFFGPFENLSLDVRSRNGRVCRTVKVSISICWRPRGVSLSRKSTMDPLQGQPRVILP